jgi:hypothetical protein
VAEIAPFARHLDEVLQEDVDVLAQYTAGLAVSGTARSASALGYPWIITLPSRDSAGQ